MIFTSPVSYYTVDSKIFSSKIKAVIHSQSSGKPLEWVFPFDKVFSNYPWHTEPEQSLDELYDKRAKQLRSKYDYIILGYSGGADSHNMLMSFYRQNLFVDEIYTSHLNKATENINTNSIDASNINAEHNLNTTQKLQWISTHMPLTKITCVDMSDHSLNFYKDESWVIESNEFVNVFATKFDIFTVKDIKLNLDKGKKVAYILGLDKPRTFIKNGYFYTSFNDIAFNGSSPEYYNKEYSNLCMEYFYWSDECAELLAKQAHIVKRYVEATPGKKYFWDTDLGYNPSVYKIFHEPWLRHVIYTTWDNGFQVKKSVGGWPNEFDAWWFRNADDKQKTVFNKGIEYLLDNAKDFIIKDENFVKGFKIFSKNYIIGKMNE